MLFPYTLTFIIKLETNMNRNMSWPYYHFINYKYATKRNYY